MRLIVCLVLGLNAAVASAAVTCEQLASIATTTQQLRDKGGTLAEVLAEADQLKSSKKLTEPELERVKDVVEQAYTGSIRTPLEILQECKDKLRR